MRLSQVAAPATPGAPWENGPGAASQHIEDDSNSQRHHVADDAHQ